MNNRLRTAMARAGFDTARLAAAIGVDAKTIDRWVRGRVPHQRNRLAVTEALVEDEANLWPAARPDQLPGAAATSEVVGAYAHRADVPHDLWVALLTGARERIDLLGYAYPFVLELTPRASALIAARAAPPSAVAVRDLRELRRAVRTGLGHGTATWR